MSDKIHVGMKFGTFDSFVNNAAKRAVKSINPSCPAYKKSFYDNKGTLFAEAWRSDNVSVQDGKRIETATITAYDENFHYSAINAGSSVGYPDAFTRIDTATQYAIDVNCNGVVDDGEIFNKK